MGITIKDVAKRAGVAHGTVSRYINGYAVGESKRMQIELAIKELDYKVNFMARGLKNSKSQIIGVVVRSLVDFFDTSIVTYIEDVLESNGYGIIICDYSCNSSRLEAKLRFLIDRSVDGIILFPDYQQLSLYQELIESKIPVVIIDNDVPGYQTDKIFADNADASYHVTEQFIRLGHRKIAIINDFTSSNSVAQNRLSGYLSALKKHNIPIVQNYLADGSFTIRCGYEATKKLIMLEDPPTAIFPASYYMAIGAIEAIREFQLRVPGDISVISFDYYEQYDSVNIPLTCVVQPIEKIGKEAATILLRRMRNDFSDFPAEKILKTSMLFRDSESAV